jgi:hypothetical protein
MREESQNSRSSESIGIVMNDWVYFLNIIFKYCL